MSNCEVEHDVIASVLSFGLCVGLIASYAPQHYKIIHAGDSEGFSPWFLLLGTTSATAASLNMFTLQLNVLRCCRQVGGLNCLDSLGGILQVSLQWLLFGMIFVLFLIYYPSDKKYARIEAYPGRPPVQTSVRTEEWRLAVILAWVTFWHFVLSLVYTVFLLVSNDPTLPYPTHHAKLWSTFLGVTSAILAVIQYLPQLYKTYKAGVVGALSIPMMLIQSPGAVVMVVSIAIRKDTNWTGWAMFAASGIMQFSLLVMCLIWKRRQLLSGLDDFGNPIDKPVPQDGEPTYSPIGGVQEEGPHEETPLLHVPGQGGRKKANWWPFSRS